VLRCKDLTHYRSKPSTQPQHFGFLVHGNSASPPSHKRKIHGAMSVIGISLTDIVKGVKVSKDAATALKAGPEGARQQFEDAHAALSSLEQAAADLIRSTSSGNPPDAIYSDLLEGIRRFQASLQPYARRLRPNTQAKPWVAIKTKLHYAFDGAPKVQKHIVTSKPAVDAALLHTMRFAFESP
jgi:hypothetical protein